MEVKLLDRVRGAIRPRHYSRRTEEAYAHWIRRYIVFHRKKHPAAMGAREIEAFLTWLATVQQVSASTQNQALSALLFLYRDVLSLDPGRIDHLPGARMPVRVPVVLSRDEVRAVMQQLDGVAWLVVALLYGAGQGWRHHAPLGGSFDVVPLSGVFVHEKQIRTDRPTSACSRRRSVRS